MKMKELMEMVEPAGPSQKEYIKVFDARLEASRSRLELANKRERENLDRIRDKEVEALILMYKELA